MRRSAAPSQQGPAPKKCFVPPLSLRAKLPDKETNGVASVRDDISRSVHDVVHLINTRSGKSLISNAGDELFRVPENQLVCGPPPAVPSIETSESVITLNNEKSVSNGHLLNFKGKQHFKSRPQLFEAIQPNGINNNLIEQASFTGESSSNAPNSEAPANYFSVMWCKVSKKKHKKWEGDAVLITRQRSVTLIDMEGKEIGRSTGYKTSELESLTDGQMLVIGGKEIEVMGVLTEEQFKSGKCFQCVTGSSCEPQATSVSSRPASFSKPFVRPFKHDDDSHPPMQLKQKNEPSLRPYFNPSAPNALVMPRPTDTHQWQYNKSGAVVVDVVVDPHVSIHLRPHQRQGVIFLYQCVIGMRPHPGLGAILADEMGLGKTLQCIALIWTLYKQGPYGGRPVVKRVLIVTPGSLVKNWYKEFRKWLSSERLSVFAVSGDKTVDDYITSVLYPVLIVSYETFIRKIETIRKVNFDLLICDEGHRLKNANIKTSSFVNSLSVCRRVVLTGTPVQNDLQELYALADFCNPGILGNLASFRRLYEEPIVTSRQPTASDSERELGQTRAHELGRITDLFVLRRTQEINNQYLPPRVDVVLFCTLSELQSKLYKALVRSRAVLSCLRETDSAQHLRCISALRKLSNHPHLLYPSAVEASIDNDTASTSEADLFRGLLSIYPANFSSTDGLSEHSGKMKVLGSLLVQFSLISSTEKVVVVSNYTSTLDLIEQLCKNYNFPLLRLDGQVPTSRRMEIVDRFNSRSSKEFIFLLSTKAGGTGLNLIGASRLVLYDVDWNPANDLQAMARVWRDGQRRTCYVYRLLSTGTIEEKIYQRQVSKQDLSGAVVDAEFSRSATFDSEQLRELFTLEEQTLSSTHDLLNCNCMSSSSDTKENPPVSAPISNRDCQISLHRSTSNVKRNTGMDELLNWTHLAGSCPDLSVLDPALESTTLSSVSFAMWTKNNA